MSNQSFADDIGQLNDQELAGLIIALAAYVQDAASAIEAFPVLADVQQPTVKLAGARCAWVGRGYPNNLTIVGAVASGLDVHIVHSAIEEGVDINFAIARHEARLS